MPVLITFSNITVMIRNYVCKEIFICVRELGAECTELHAVCVGAYESFIFELYLVLEKTLLQNISYCTSA